MLPYSSLTCQKQTQGKQDMTASFDYINVNIRTTWLHRFVFKKKLICQSLLPWKHVKVFDFPIYVALTVDLQKKENIKHIIQHAPERICPLFIIFISEASL